MSECPDCESPYHGRPCPRTCSHGGAIERCCDPTAPPIYPAVREQSACACGGPCEHDESLARALRFQRAFDAEMLAAR